MTSLTSSHPLNYLLTCRAVGAGPAARPIFGQLTRAKALVSCLIVALKVPTLEGTSAVIHKISVGTGGKHALSPEGSIRRSVSFGKIG